jgi:hypothetical protein
MQSLREDIKTRHSLERDHRICDRKVGRTGGTATRLHSTVEGLRCSSPHQHKGVSTRLTAHAVANVSETRATDCGVGIRCGRGGGGTAKVDWLQIFTINRKAESQFQSEFRWYERANSCNRQIMILRRKTKTWTTWSCTGFPSESPGPTNLYRRPPPPPPFVGNVWNVRVRRVVSYRLNIEIFFPDQHISSSLLRACVTMFVG